uniref:Uncharacterized protein n=1 Tax=Setaria viridis TaxID=4556 RepID=A0A4U6V6U8_SETVI|nr:hypothetical protein SEVIR_4G279400v2 [Setaria viridis]
MLLCRCCSALLLPASAEPLLLLARVLENPPGDMAPARSCQRSRTGGLALVKEGAGSLALAFGRSTISRNPTKGAQKLLTCDRSGGSYVAHGSYISFLASGPTEAHHLLHPPPDHRPLLHSPGRRRPRHPPTAHSSPPPRPSESCTTSSPPPVEPPPPPLTFFSKAGGHGNPQESRNSKP